MNAIAFHRSSYSESILATLLVWLLLFSAAFAVASGLSDAIQGGNVDWFILVGILGILIGWSFSSNFNGHWWAYLSAGLLGILVIGILEAQSLSTLINLAWVSAGFFGTIAPAPTRPLETQLFLAKMITSILTDTGGVYIRIIAWLKTVATQNPATDPLALNMFWGIPLWFVFSWSGWSVRRYDQGLIALLPPLILLASVSGYVRSSPTGLVATMGIVLLLVVLTGHLRNEHRWLLTNFDFSRDIRFDLAMTAIPLCLFVVMISSFIPSISIKEIAQDIHHLFEVPNNHPLPESFGLQPQNNEDNPVAQQESAGLPRIHLLGSGPELSYKLVMEIKTNELPSVPDASVFHHPIPIHYWRSMTYDIYTGQGWASSSTITSSYDSNDRILLNPLPTRSIFQQKVATIENVGGILYASGEVITVNNPFRVTARTVDDPFAITTSAKTYTVTSSVIYPDPVLLGKAGINYPDWIKQRYLALPDDLPARIRTLAISLTSSSTTPYDRAKDIEAYLRTFPYTLDLKAPPSDRDVVDYFLFDLKKGYCDYYASAMVVMARITGIPARLAVGYASGSYDAVNSRYEVTEADAHSWPELYFPNYGWVDFEPTSGRTEPDNSSVIQSNSISPNSPGFLTPTPFSGGAQITQQIRLQATLIIILSLIVVVLLTSSIWIGRFRYSRMTVHQVLKNIYADLLHYSRSIRVTIQPGDTPLEINQTINECLNKINENTRWKTNQVIIKKEVEYLISLYIRSIYSDHTVALTDSQVARQMMLHLRWRFWVAWLISFTRTI